MVLGAGLGTRMRPLTDRVPKPLVRLAGRALIDHVLDGLARAGVARAVVNVHHLADALEAHLARRPPPPRIVISDERAHLLDTGGGVHQALPLLGPDAFFVHNSDSVWLEPESGPDTLARMIAAWDDDAMDCLMLLAPVRAALGHAGRGDFVMDVPADAPEDAAGRLTRAGAEAQEVQEPREPLVFAGVSIAHPRLFAGAPAGPFSLNRLWDRAARAGRLFGVRHGGLWMHVGSPDALAAAERVMADARR